MMVSNCCRRLLSAALLALTLGLALGSAGAADLSGQPLPELNLPPLHGSAPALDRASLHGKVVYLDFWASWCVPCRASFPWLQALHAKYQKQGLLIVGVNKDQELADAERFLAKFPVGFALVRDPDDALATRLALIGMPTAYLIDRQGVIRGIHKGFRSDDQAALERTIVALLEHQP